MSEFLNRIIFNNLKSEDQNLVTVMKGGILGLFGLSIVTLANFIHQFILAKTLTPADLGIYNLASTMTSLVGLAVVFGLDRAVSLYIAVFIGKGDREHELGVVTSSMVVITITTLLFTPAFWFLTRYLSLSIFHKPELIEVSRILTLSVPCWALIRLSMSILQGYGSIKLVVIIEQMFFSILRVIGLIAAFNLFAKTSTTAAYSYLWAALICFFISVITVRNYYLRRKGDKKPSLMLLELVAFSWPLFVASILYRTNAFTETIILGIFSPAEQVGLYTFSYKLSMTLIIFFEASQLIITPYFGNLFGKGAIGELARQYRIVSYWTFLIILPFALWMFLEASNIIAIFNSAFIPGGRLLQMLILTQLVFIIIGPASVTLIISGYAHVDLFNLILLLVLSLILDFLLIPTYGAIGAAFAGLISIVIVNLIRSIQIYSILKINPFCRDELIPVTSGIIASFCMLSSGFYYRELTPLLHIIISGLIIFIVYGISTVLLRKLAVFDSTLDNL